MASRSARTSSAMDPPLVPDWGFEPVAEPAAAGRCRPEREGAPAVGDDVLCAESVNGSAARRGTEFLDAVAGAESSQRTAVAGPIETVPPGTVPVMLTNSEDQDAPR